MNWWLEFNGIFVDLRAWVGVVTGGDFAGRLGWLVFPDRGSWVEIIEVLT